MSLSHSMDDENTYGQEIFNLNFSEAIDQKLLCDYKVSILSINQTYTSNQIQSILDDTELNLDDASKLVGIYKALRDQGREKGKKLARAVGFASTINFSKRITNHFNKVVGVLNEYQNDGFTCETDHVDGTHSSLDKNAKLDWLREPVPKTKRGEKVCRVLMNAKCLTEGVDVPNLDAVLFFAPEKISSGHCPGRGTCYAKTRG